jgi:hypothetical protein
VGFVDHHRPAIEPMTVQLPARFVGVGRRHFHEGEAVAHDRYGQNLSDAAEQILHCRGGRAVGEVPDQKLLDGCRRLHSYASLRIIIHRHEFVKE